MLSWSPLNTLRVEAKIESGKPDNVPSVMLYYGKHPAMGNPEDKDLVQFQIKLICHILLSETNHNCQKE